MQVMTDDEANALGVLIAGFQSEHPSVAEKSAYVLGRLEGPGMSWTLLRLIDELEPLLFTTLRDHELDEEQTAQMVSTANRVTAGLKGIYEIGGETKTVYPWFRALGLPAPAIAELAARCLRKRLDAAEFTEALFGFLAVRNSFREAEVDIYTNALTSYEAEATAPTVQSLERLLTAAEGSPDGVPWIYKLIGLTALTKVGDSSSLPILQAYSADPGSYYRTSNDEDSGAERSRVELTFADLASDAIAAVGSPSH
jgi:hypothetical protein